MLRSPTLTSLQAQLAAAAAAPGFLRRVVALGGIGTLLMLLGSVGAGGVLVHDPILGGTPLAAIRYGHGQYVAVASVYLGVGLLVWAWIRLGNAVLDGRVGCREVVIALLVWIAPLLIAAPLFSRDVYSYLAQGLLPLHGYDPYAVGPAVLPGPLSRNVHPFWQTTPAPYGPLFIGISEVVVWLFGDNVIAGVIAMRLLLLSGLAMLLYSLPGLVRHLGGNLAVALWLVAGPVTVVHLVGGPHNDLLVIGLLALGTLFTLDRKHAGGIALVTMAMAVKATAGLALPFLVWVWAARLSGTRWQRLCVAGTQAVLVFAAVFTACTVAAGVGLGWIGALSAPALIISYLSVPTGLGQLAHGVIAGLGDVAGFGFADVRPWAIIDMFRLLGMATLVAILAWQWWQAREGGTDAVRRAALLLLLGALLSPVTHPWYLTWALPVAAALPWTRRTLSYVVGVSVILVLCYYPNGESALYNWPYIIVAAALSAYAAYQFRAGRSVTRHQSGTQHLRDQERQFQ